jgi:hypothetical protein
MKIKFLLAIALIILSRINSIAQESDTIKFDYLSFYFNGQVAVPAKEFREAINNSVGDLGVGLAGGFLFSPFGQKKPSPILLGVDIGYTNYGVEKIGADSNNPALKITHNIYSFDAIGRLRHPNHHNKKVIPFIDGLLGLKLYNTRIKVDKNLIDVIFNTDDAEVLDNVNDTGLNFGLGAGFYTHPKNFNGIGFTMRALYMWGDEVEYVVRNSVKRSNGTLTYETAKANTSMLTIQLGITGFSFSKLVN